MNFVLTAGSAFIWDGHIWFVLSDPKANRGEVLCVNLTSLDEECPDDECFLDHSDYGWIETNHVTAVAFLRHGEDNFHGATITRKPAQNKPFGGKAGNDNLGARLRSGLPSSAVSVALLSLEMKRVVKQLPGKLFVRNR